MKMPILNWPTFRPLALALAATFALAPLAGPAKADVWTANNTWDDAADAAFGAWIKNLPLDVFSRPDSPYYGISTDCAEAVYSLRTIFAYENSLPVHFKNYDGVDLSNTNKDFDGAPEGKERLFKFIHFLKQHINTGTLTADTYPIEINRTYLKEGAVFLHPESGNEVPVTYRSGHVYYIQGVLENGMVLYFSSTVPIMVRDMQPRIDIDFAPMNKIGGYRAWKRPEVGAPQPGYSQEQFTFAHWRPKAYGDGNLWDAWQRVIRKRLQLRKATAKEEVDAKLENVRGYIRERNKLVQVAWDLYQKQYLPRGRMCMNDLDYDNYSTPSRDTKIQSELDALRVAVVNYINSPEGISTTQTQIFASYQFEVMPGVTLDGNQLWQTFWTNSAFAISEPEHSPDVRWGLKQISQWPCPKRNTYVDYSKKGTAPAEPSLPPVEFPVHFKMPWQ